MAIFVPKFIVNLAVELKGEIKLEAVELFSV